jgi:hypothetical protein
MPEPKRHHYVPESYSKAFAGQDGYVRLFDKWDRLVRTLQPKNALVVGNLYRQPVHAEKRFDNAIEVFFANAIDTDWPSLRDTIEKRVSLNQDQWGKLVRYVCAQLVRVPLSMNAVIELLRDEVFFSSKNSGPIPETLVALNRKITEQEASELRHLVESGTVILKIDPHRSISSMPLLIKNVPIFQHNFSFGIPKFLHNETDLNFITSDNPIVFHLGGHGVKAAIPYKVSPKQDFAFYFAISPRTMMVNSTFNSKRTMHCPIKDRGQVSSLNRMIARYSYRFIMSDSEELAWNYGDRYSDICPRPNFYTSSIFNGYVEQIGYKFGPPTKIENRREYDFLTSARKN